MKKRTISLLVAAAITAGCLAGCGGGTTGTTTAAGAGGTEADAGSPQDSASGKDSLVIAMASDILSMDPYKYDEGPTNQVMLHIYEAMLMQDADMKFQPCLAESWETSDDGLTWTFHLRKGVKFHDGEEMDVVVGTGRYKFVEQVKEDHLDLTANEDYWGEVPEIKNVRFRPITNEATRTATMLTGEVDFTIDISVRDIDRLDGTDGISVLRQQGLREIYLNLDSREDSPLFPGQKNPMSDPKVRHAMYLAIDEDTIIKNIMNGCAFEMNSILPENYVGYTPVEREAYDPEKAKQLLAEAGYPDGFEVTLDASNDRYMNDEQIAQAVAGYLEKVGIKVNLNLMPKSNFFTYIKPAENKSMLLQTGWSDASGDGLSLLHDMLRTYNREAGQGTVNRGHYSNPEVDALISQAFTEFDDAKRGELVAEADKIARDDYAYIPLHFEQDTYAIKDTLNYTPRMNKYVLAWEFSYK